MRKNISVVELVIILVLIVIAVRIKAVPGNTSSSAAKTDTVKKQRVQLLDQTYDCFVCPACGGYLMKMKTSSTPTSCDVIYVRICKKCGWSSHRKTWSSHNTCKFR